MLEEAGVAHGWETGSSGERAGEGESRDFLPHRPDDALRMTRSKTILDVRGQLIRRFGRRGIGRPDPPGDAQRCPSTIPSELPPHPSPSPTTASNI